MTRGPDDDRGGRWREKGQKRHKEVGGRRLPWGEGNNSPCLIAPHPGAEVHTHKKKGSQNWNFFFPSHAGRRLTLVYSLRQMMNHCDELQNDEMLKLCISVWLYTHKFIWVTWAHMGARGGKRIDIQVTYGSKEGQSWNTRTTIFPTVCPGRQIIAFF